VALLTEKTQKTNEKTERKNTHQKQTNFMRACKITRNERNFLLFPKSSKERNFLRKNRKTATKTYLYKEGVITDI